MYLRRRHYISRYGILQLRIRYCITRYVLVRTPSETFILSAVILHDIGYKTDYNIVHYMEYGISQFCLQSPSIRLSHFLRITLKYVTRKLDGGRKMVKCVKVQLCKTHIIIRTCLVSERITIISRSKLLLFLQA